MFIYATIIEETIISIFVCGYIKLVRLHIMRCSNRLLFSLLQSDIYRCYPGLSDN